MTHPMHMPTPWAFLQDRSLDVIRSSAALLDSKITAPKVGFITLDLGPMSVWRNLGISRRVRILDALVMLRRGNGSSDESKPGLLALCDSSRLIPQCGVVGGTSAECDAQSKYSDFLHVRLPQVAASEVGRPFLSRPSLAELEPVSHGHAVPHCGSI